MKKFMPVIIAAGVLALGFLAFKLFAGQPVEGGVSNANLSSEIPKPKADAPDFGPLPDQYVIGKTPGGPGGPSAPGAGPTAPKVGR